MFALVKPDLRACTRLLSVAAAARRSQLASAAACSSPLLLDLDADGTCSMMMMSFICSCRNKI
jgi:hypothetical protein